MTITQTTDKASICALLSAHIGQRSGIKTGDYVSDWRDKEGLKALRSEQYSVARDGQEARLLLAWVEGRNGITGEDIVRASKGAYSGRLSITEDKLDYCTGQYFATEYRAAACSVLAAAIREYWRRDGNDWRKLAKDYFGRGVYSRWFD